MSPKALLVIVIFCNVQKRARQPQSHFRPMIKSIRVLPPKIALFKKETWSGGRFLVDEMGGGNMEGQKTKPAISTGLGPETPEPTVN